MEKKEATKKRYNGEKLYSVGMWFDITTPGSNAGWCLISPLLSTKRKASGVNFLVFFQFFPKMRSLNFGVLF